MRSKLGGLEFLPVIRESILGVAEVNLQSVCVNRQIFCSSTNNWQTFPGTDQPLWMKRGSEVENPTKWTATFSPQFDRFSHMERPNRFRYRQTEARVSSKIDDGESI